MTVRSWHTTDNGEAARPSASEETSKEAQEVERPRPQTRPFQASQELRERACSQAFRVTSPPIAGSEMLSRRVSMCPVSRYSKLLSSATVTTRSYQPPTRWDEGSNSTSPPGRSTRVLLSPV